MDSAFQLSEKMGLIHISKGAGKDRHIVVSKPGRSSPSGVKTTVQSPSENSERPNTEKPVNQAVKSSPTEKEDLKGVPDTQEVPSQKESDKIVCRHCSKSVIKANIQLHETHCLRQQREKSAPKSANSVGKKQKNASVPKIPNTHADVMAKLDKVDGDDLDSLIAAVQSVDRVCSFKKCKTSTQTLSQSCEFCRRRFCLSHHIPEVHGCGEAAKAHARATIIREGVLYRGSGVPDKKPDPTQKAQLQRKLDKKLTEMATKRQAKKSKK